MTEVLSSSIGSVSVTDAWMSDPARACKDTSWDLFFPIEVDPYTLEESEPAYPPPVTKRLCDGCEVRADCLAWALTTGQEYGIWGGMTSYERGLINTPRTRVSCPGCGSHDVVTEARGEVCLACGVSWPIVA